MSHDAFTGDLLPERPFACQPLACLGSADFDHHNLIAGDRTNTPDPFRDSIAPGIIVLADLEGKTVATHLPVTTREWLSSKGITADVVAMGGALEGVCALGLADAIVDLRQTGNSLAINDLQTIEVLARCEATFAWDTDRAAELGWLTTQIQAAVDGRKAQYLMFHLPAEQVGNLGMPSQDSNRRPSFPSTGAPTWLLSTSSSRPARCGHICRVSLSSASLGSLRFPCTRCFPERRKRKLTQNRPIARSD